MQHAHDVIIKPVVSEKSYGLIDADNCYTFVVQPSANKNKIKRAVETIWNVKVANVRTITRQGKAKRFGLVVGRRPGQKRALVTLAEGETIDIFSGGL